MPEPHINRITTTNLDLHAALEAIDEIPGLHPTHEIQLTQTEQPGAHLTISWGTQPHERAIIREGKAHRHGE
jgi:hypothetical protein